MGFNLTRATGYTKVMNLASNLTSLAFFAFAGQVRYLAGITMGAGQLLGARLGSHMVVTRGTKFIRPIFLTMVLAVTIKLPLRYLPQIIEPLQRRASVSTIPATKSETPEKFGF